MKKLLALLLAATMLLSLCACGSSSAPKDIEDISDEDWEAAAEALEDMYEEEPVAETEATEKIYQIGDTALTSDGLFEVTINNAYFVDRIDWNTCAPAAEGGETPKEGKTYLFVTGTYNLVGDLKKTMCLWGSIVVEYSDVKFYQVQFGFVQENGTVEYEVVLEPLMEYEPVEFRTYIEVPEVVETNSEEPLLVTMRDGTMNGVKGTCTFQIR